MKTLKHAVSLLLVLCMILGLTASAFASEKSSDAGQAGESVQETTDGAAEESTEKDSYYKIVHLDCGRKYFSVNSIKSVIDVMAEAGFEYLELAVGNDGLRFLLDDMTLTVNGQSYSSETVAAGIQTGNREYYDAGTVDELTEAEMDEIISYALEKGIEIIPLINTPGHMDAILSCMKTCGLDQAAYADSKRTVDVTNKEAVAFTQALLKKYIAYFAGKGCTFFNMGADEYANDVYASGGMGFGQLQSTGQYGAFVEYVNEMAAMIKEAGMTPMAFNDGIYYNRNTSSGTFDTDIKIAYWSGGWNGYQVASASFLKSQGFDLINTNGDYYWVLGKSDAQCTEEKAAGFDDQTFQGNDVISDPAGSMFCIWCDYPGAGSEASVIEGTSEVIRAFGSALPGYEQTVSDSTGTVSVTGPALRELTCMLAEAPSVEGAEQVVAYNVTPYTVNGAYTGEAQVSIAVPEGWEESRTGAFIVDGDGSVTKLSGSVRGGICTFTAPHFSVIGLYEAAAGGTGEEIAQETVTLAVGGTAQIIVENEDLTGSVNRNELDFSVAEVEVEFGESAGERIPVKADSVTSGASYYISDGNGHYLSVSSEGTLISADNIEKATQWRLSSASDGYYISSGSYYLRHRNDILSLSSNRTYASWRYDGDGGFYYSSWLGWTTNYLSFESSGWQISEDSSVRGFAYTAEAGEPGTVITFSGVSEGTTYVTVGNTRYTIQVEDSVPEDAMTGNTLEIEYWITNSRVYEGGQNSSASSAVIDSAQASIEDGVAVTDRVPDLAYSYYDGTVEVRYWQAERLDSGNHQSGEEGDDETADGTVFTHVRYHSGAWQYKTTDGVWHYFSSGDQAVAYYMRHTELTQEITTAVKDWGYDPTQSGGTPNTSGGQGQVALTVAVVYPDGTVSPSEGDMYSSSTTIFNYWSGRDIGIIVPINNSDYTVSRITVTDGARDNNINANVWYSRDSITWEKTTNAAGSQWYDETEIWNSSMGTSPMVNGALSNITWSAKNTAKLVLIYLEPVHRETNLQVQWVDDTAGGTLISRQEVVVEEGVTFLTNETGLQQSSPVQAGTITLDDNAYIVNSSGVEQTFNKDITTIPDVAPQYTSGLYQYVSAEISEDGTILTLHYRMNSEALNKQYIVDFGLPVEIHISELVDNESQVTSVVVSSNLEYNVVTRTVRYTPGRILQETEAAAVRVSYSNGQSATFNIGFVPATTVYYEEGFAELNGFTGGSRGDRTQAASEAGSGDHYGYDAAYTLGDGSTVSASNGTYAVSTTAGSTAEFTFRGTGVAVYMRETTDTGYILIQVKDQNGSVKKMMTVNTVMASGSTDLTDNQEFEDGSFPSAVIDVGMYGVYTVQITHIKPGTEAQTAPVCLDGFRVYNTLGTLADSVYASDGEANPEYVNLRDALLTGYHVSDVPAEDSDYIFEGENGGRYYVEQVYDSEEAGENQIAYIGSGNLSAESIADLLDNGPKNQIYLPEGSGITFEVNGGFESLQIGLKALQEEVTYNINGSTALISTSTDMFYKLKVNSGETVTITNVSGGILAVTDLKVLGGDVQLSVPEQTLEAAAVQLDTIRNQENLEAEAVLVVEIRSLTGKTVSKTELSVKGTAGDTYVFTAEEISAAASQASQQAGYRLISAAGVQTKAVRFGTQGNMVCYAVVGNAVRK